MTVSNTRTKVVVIGGGYAGTMAANHLRMRADIDVTLVNPRPKFVARIRLHQLVAGSHKATVVYSAQA
jgi:NADH dehydrogenase